ncbi:MAG: peptide chain release factor aRF-1 [Candidatus Altiarchaeota archaeon]
MDSQKQFKLKKLIRELKEKRGRHTELITVYVPQGYSMINILKQLQDEQGTASNIKSRTTKKNVTDALEKTIQNLKLYNRTPPNGLAVFCGNVSEREGQQDLRIWAVEPPEPISTRLYRCEQEFLLGPLEALVTPSDSYGLIAIDNKTATIATLKGSNYTIHKKLTSGYHGKHRAGGQSQRRFERVIREQSHEFKVRVGEQVNSIFLPIIKDVRGIVIGGPAITKDDFVAGDYIHHELKKKIIAVKDTTYTDESGIRELIDKAQDDLSSVEMVRQKTLFQRFMRDLVGGGNVAYGPDVEKSLKAGAVETLLLSEKLSEGEIDKYYDMATQTGALVEIVSDEFEEGYQLWNTFKGKAALLRYKVQA